MARVSVQTHILNYLRSIPERDLYKVFGEETSQYQELLDHREVSFLVEELVRIRDSEPTAITGQISRQMLTSPGVHAEQVLSRIRDIYTKLETETKLHQILNPPPDEYLT